MSKSEKCRFTTSFGAIGKCIYCGEECFVNINRRETYCKECGKFLYLEIDKFQDFERAVKKVSDVVHSFERDFHPRLIPHDLQKIYPSLKKSENTDPLHQTQSEDI